MADPQKMLTEMKNPEEVRAYLINKAKDDEAFRSQLLADPKAAIKQEFNLTLPDAFTVQVHEDSATSAHIVLPPTQSLDASAMRGVSGGWGDDDCMYN